MPRRNEPDPHRDLPGERPYSGDNVPGPGRSIPYGQSRLAGPITVVDTAAQIEKASTLVTHQASAQLELIARQIRMLQNQAQEILDKAQRDLDLHTADCRFRKVSGEIYHLYRKTDGGLSFSMLSPEDYGGSPPHEYVRSYRLEPNDSWTPCEEIESTERERRELRAYLLPPSKPR